MNTCRTLSEIDTLLLQFPNEWITNWCRNIEGCGCRGGVNCCINVQLSSRGVKPINEQEWQLWMEKRNEPNIQSVKSHIYV
jgi:hypothetical protein